MTSPSHRQAGFQIEVLQHRFTFCITGNWILNSLKMQEWLILSPISMSASVSKKSLQFSNLHVFAAGSDFPPVQRCEQRCQRAWSAAAAEKSAAAGSARWCSDTPEWHYGASPAGRTPEEQGSTWIWVGGCAEEQQSWREGWQVAM